MFSLGTTVKLGNLVFDATLDPAFLQNPFAQLMGGTTRSTTTPTTTAASNRVDGGGPGRLRVPDRVGHVHLVSRRDSSRSSRRAPRAPGVSQPAGERPPVLTGPDRAPWFPLQRALRARRHPDRAWGCRPRMVTGPKPRRQLSMHKGNSCHRDGGAFALMVPAIAAASTARMSGLNVPGDYVRVTTPACTRTCRK